MSKELAVLAFSGGLDTSFCVPYLIDQGFDVITVFVDTGGVDEAEKKAIHDRAMELGAKEHICEDGSQELWDDFVVPLIMAGESYQNAYPLLCSDRYLIVKRCLEICKAKGTNYFAHGCTGMGNDQVRFDLTVESLGKYKILSPIREIQKEHGNVREYEEKYLAHRGFAAPGKSGKYSINANILGVTVSGSEIDDFEAPGEESYSLCARAKDWPNQPLRVDIGFENGLPILLNNKKLSGPQMLSELNQLLGSYGVGRSIYTGDTIIGLKGRIVFECPAITALLTAHKALEETVFSSHQNSFKPFAAKKWVELVYKGLFYDPLKFDLEAFLKSSQRNVSGIVTLETEGAAVYPVKISSDNMLVTGTASYAQSADWDIKEAMGFIKLFGQSSVISNQVNPQNE